VFLGRKSTVPNCAERNPDQRPFGCAVLAAAAGPSEQRNTLFQAPLKAITSVRVRLRAPTVQEKETSVYSCPVRTMNEGETISIGAVVDVIAGGDTFYWGAVKGRRQDCSDTNPG
jgi:hypothetical protein